MHYIHEGLSWAHPLVQTWFTQKFGAPTEPQLQGWPSILAGESTLISAPTGSGKTLAAFLASLDKLIRDALTGKLPDETKVLYVSPLKALSNDVQKNLLEPLQEISGLAKSQDLFLPEIRVAVRTGDTLVKERQAMLKKPPHILVTTPESLYILLTAEKSRARLQQVHTVIIDEIHAIANSKRGAHLMLSLERLSALTPLPPIRIGLSATQKPIERVAAFLAGHVAAQPKIVNIGHARHLDIAIEVPASELGAVASNEMWDEIYDKVCELANTHRSTLVFVNTRRLAERMAHHLTEKLGEDKVTAHHGSLSRKLRLDAENKLKNGELSVLVATASLELGIDIGTIDLVCQIGSPRSIATALQRIGRAGHWHSAISKGRIFVTTRDELVECAALVYAIRTEDLDKLIIPDEPIDILAQQIVAMCAASEWRVDDLFLRVKNAYPYQHLTRETFNNVIQMLAEGISGSRGRYSAYLFYDQVNSIIKGKRGSRLTAITSGGAIPDNGLFTVIAEPQGVMVGTLDEDFAVESNRGDVILLGTTSWMIIRIEHALGRVLVEDAHGAPPSVPFWRGEAPARTEELSLQTANLRERIHQMLPMTKPAATKVAEQPNANTAIRWLEQSCGLNLSGAEQLIEYILQGRAVLGAVPTQHTVIVERFFDEAGGMQLIIHSPFGARINKAWGLALRKKFCRSFNFELQASATDDGINIALAEQHSFPLADVFHFLHPNTIKEVLVQAVLQSPLFNTRWRWVATRALALVRFRGGKKVPPNIQRMLSDDLLAAVFPDAAACQDNLAGQEIQLPDHPLISETMKDCLTEALDMEGLAVLLTKILNHDIQCLAVDTPVPSPFSHEILNANPYAFLDDAPLEERRARAVEMRRMLPESVLQEVGKLDEDAIKEVFEQAWPDIRNSDELHDLLQTFIAIHQTHPLIPHQWQQYLPLLLQEKRITTAKINHLPFLVAAEKVKTFLSIYPEAIIDSSLKEIETLVPEREEAIVTMIKGWIFHLGPTTTAELSELLQLPAADIDYALLKLETIGLILRGHFRSDVKTLEWCERRLLARIHKATLGRLRKEIEPVTAAQFMLWLLKWQHVAQGTQLSGEQGLLEILKQLQGFEIAANAWENEILTKRMTNYSPHLLDRLCLNGTIGWGRLSVHPANSDEDNKKRVIPTSIAPITFFIRSETSWMPKQHETENLTGLSHVAIKVYEFLKQRGASFFPDIVRGVDHLKAEIETALWELVTAGFITADGFDNLRSLINPKRRLDPRHRNRPRFSLGRWSLLYTHDKMNREEHAEACCWLLLRRYGVVFRDLLTREKNMPPWRELLIMFRRLEARGEIRGGRFVSGFIGEQFALPYAAQSLRAIKKQPLTDDYLTLSAVDPLNLIGIILPGDKIPAFSGNQLTLKNGILIDN